MYKWLYQAISGVTHHILLVVTDVLFTSDANAGSDTGKRYGMGGVEAN